ncbi:hypothetical protein M3O57_20165 [Xanthomonas nasturtii]|uniref:Uncharacterized protein n=1 Tax=Xanthomonas nasturtii TaxID=1843581 RepID=A0A3E1KES9_9XANT|nr:hypothetical protein [Xanthomonas nasturtii]MCL1501441.1 hypothetical protein [Xanthomonas nasturtii]MCL1505348.1 hypothetical protein [Xanthomonas nasturtii]MCL1524857.1 hypothetical protein [Xanthomonas nasturtii]MCL1532637.1 hypothetical protein [Xanthomonas nasturtii]MCL1553724.1 hypothetical protein [Xanthomonas nasturtii]
MSNKTFDWMQLTNGRARFTGSIRGADELGHETFSVEINGSEYFGEITQDFLPDRENFNLVIDSFGYGNQLEVGMPLPSSSTAAFSSQDLEHVKALILELIKAGLDLERRPIVISETERSKFMGNVSFPENWALCSNNKVH